MTLESTPKLLSLLRGWFPLARLVGWKFEASGDKESALAAARAQILKNKTDACVLNGPSYGEGFGILDANGEFHHLPDRTKLCIPCQENPRLIVILSPFFGSLDHRNPRLLDLLRLLLGHPTLRGGWPPGIRDGYLPGLLIVANDQADVAVQGIGLKGC